MGEKKEMKVLTVKQPWAHLICFGTLDGRFKDIENRSWRTKYRGRVLIHSSKQDDKPALIKALDFGLVQETDLLRGAIQGSVEITDCVEDSDSPWFKGPVGWVLKNPRPEKIEFCKGKLGLWTYNL